MKRYQTIGLLFSLLAVGACSNLGNAPVKELDAPAAPVIEGRADAVLKGMSEFLAAKPVITVDAERVEERVRYSGQKIEFSTDVSLALRRPGHLLARQSGSDVDLQVAIRPGSITVYGAKTQGVVRLQGPNTVDAGLDLLALEHGVNIAMLDLLVSDPYASAKRTMRTGEYIGLVKTDGVSCHHLAFTAKGLDWEIWIDAGAEPVPRRLKIVYPGTVGSPSLCVRNMRWTFPASLADDRLDLNVPVGVKETTIEAMLQVAE